MSHTTAPFGTMPDGTPIATHTLKNNLGMRLTAVEYGAILTNLLVPDYKSNPVDILLGQDTLQAYVSGGPFAGAVIGRVANRISQAQFELDGRAYTLEKNSGECNIHSGSGRYAYRVFEATDSSDSDSIAVTFSLLDHGEGGFPGEVQVTVRYALSRQSNTFTIFYHALPSENTPINLTNHAYFNLAGHNSGSITNHVFKIDADFYLPSSPGGMPTGEILSVTGSPFDWRHPHTLQACLDECGHGFDHHFCVRGHGLRHAATAFAPESGIEMKVFTDLPGMQFFTPSRPAQSVAKGQTLYPAHAGFCFETQHCPNAINFSQFPSNIYSPANPFYSQTSFVFSIQAQ